MFTTKLANWEYTLLGVALLLVIALATLAYKSPKIDFSNAFAPADQTQKLDFRRSAILGPVDGPHLKR